MAPLLIRRAVELPFVLLAVMFIVFLALVSTGDPVEMMVPPEATEADKIAVREAYGLDKPMLVQFTYFVGNAVKGDFGNSLFQRQPALDLVLDRLPTTMKLALASVAIAVIGGVPLGVIAALKRGSIWDISAMGISLLGQTIAGFWLALMLILVFSVKLGWFPVSGDRGDFRSLVLPALSLSVTLLALLARITRSGMLEIMGEDFIRTARAKGLTETAIVVRHALRHVMIQIITVTALSLGWQFGGAVVIESVFAWQGVGTLMLKAVLQRDYPVVLASVTILATFFILLNMISDLLYPLVDPRLKRSGGA